MKNINILLHAHSSHLERNFQNCISSVKRRHLWPLKNMVAPFHAFTIYGFAKYLKTLSIAYSVQAPPNLMQYWPQGILWDPSQVGSKKSEHGE